MRNNQVKEKLTKKELNNIRQWVAENHQHREFIADAVKFAAPRANECAHCFVLKVSEKMSKDKLIKPGKAHLEKVQVKVLESLRGEFCGGHSAFAYYEQDAAEFFIERLIQEGWDCIEGEFDPSMFNDALYAMPEETFTWVLSRIFASAIFLAEELVLDEEEAI